MIGNIFGDSMHQKWQESLANAVLGVISSASLIVHRMGLGLGLSLAKAKKLFGKHGIKQVDRLLSNPKLHLPKCFEKTVPYLIGSRQEIVVTVSLVMTPLQLSWMKAS